MNGDDSQATIRSRRSRESSSAARTREEALAMVSLPQLKSAVQKIWKFPSKVWLPLGKASSHGLPWNGVCVRVESKST